MNWDDIKVGDWLLLTTGVVVQVKRLCKRTNGQRDTSILYFRRNDCPKKEMFMRADKIKCKVEIKELP